MSEEPPPADRRAPPPRPWWAPLLSVGSVGLGGMQGIGGAFLLFAATQFRGDTAGAFLLIGLAWLLPGIVLAAGGVGLLVGAPWGRKVSVAAVLLGACGIGFVAARRTTIPPAMADAIEFVSNHPDAQKGLGETLANLRKGPNGDPVAALREPEQADLQGWIYTGYCCCPVLPWYLLLLFACIPAWGKRLERPEDPPTPPTSAG